MEQMLKFASLEVEMHDLSRELEEVRRWGHYRRVAERETVLQHTVKGAILAQVMIAIERAAGTVADFNAYRILAAAIVHDFGEGAIGDVRYEIKLDPRVRPVLEEHERNAFNRFARLMPQEALESLSAAYELQNDRASFEGRFFNALERLGYMFWAVREFLAGKLVYREVFQNQHRHLVAYMDEFASVRILYGPIAPEIEKILADGEGNERTVAALTDEQDPVAMK